MDEKPKSFEARSKVRPLSEQRNARNVPIVDDYSVTHVREEDRPDLIARHFFRHIDRLPEPKSTMAQNEADEILADSMVPVKERTRRLIEAMGKYFHIGNIEW